MNLIARVLSRLSSLALLILRAVLGVVMAYHGWQKFDAGTSTFAGVLEGLGVPAPELLAVLVAIAELVGGVLLVLGLLTRLAAIATGAVLVGAISLVKADIGLIAPMGGGVGMELDISILAGLVALLILGPGRLSLDYALGLDRVHPAPVTGPARRRGGEGREAEQTPERQPAPS